MDRAGWHTTDKLKVPKNITIILLPSRSPELNPVENIWQYMRQNWLSNRVFETYDAIIDAGTPTPEPDGAESWSTDIQWQAGTRASHRRGAWVAL